MSLETITPSGFYAINLGNGENVQLLWSVADIYAVKYFVIERYDPYDRRWVPYDGFHGMLTKEDGDGTKPPLRVNAIVDESGSHSFRIKAVGFDGEESGWSSTSVDVVVLSGDSGASHLYFVDSGLEVEQLEGRTFTVQTGVAFIGGTRVPLLHDADITVGDENRTHLICLTNSGTLISTTETQTPAGSIRLAEVSFDSAGRLTSTKDTRFGWAPTGLNVVWDSENRITITMKATWNAVVDPIVAQYIIYRAPKGQNLSAIATVEKESLSFTDNNGLANGAEYDYAVGIVDWGNHKSPVSSRFSAQAGDIVPPAKPVGLTLSSDSSDEDGTYIDLSWTENSESDMLCYRVYLIDSYDIEHFLAEVEQPKYRHSDLQAGRTYKYAVTALDFMRNESSMSNIEEVVAGDIIPPTAPTWKTPAFSTGGNASSVWADVFINNSPEPDVAHYRLYTRTGTAEPYTYTFNQEYEDTNIRLMLDGSLRGFDRTFVVMAVDKWGNRSAYSEARTVHLGGYKPKKPVISSLVNLTDNGVDKIKIAWDAVTQDVQNNNITVAQYKIYRGANALNLIHIQTVDGSTEWTDSTVERGKTYYYAVLAVDTNVNESDRSTAVSLKAGDFDAPSPPTVNDHDTLVEGSKITNWIHFTMGTEADLRGVKVYKSLEDDHYQLAGYFEKLAGMLRYEDTEVKNGVNYYYALTSIDFSGNENLITEASKVGPLTAGDITPPQAPTLTLAPGWIGGVASISGSWPAVDGITKYRVYRSISGVTYTMIEETSAISFTDSNLINGNSYYYYVVSVNALDVESTKPETINPVLAGDTTAPESPTSVTITADYTNSPNVKLTISYTDSVSLDKDMYEIWRSLDGATYSLLTQTAGTSIEDKAIYEQHVYYKVYALDGAGNRSVAATNDINLLDSTAPGDVGAPTFTATQLPGGLFSLAISWTSYAPPPDFLRYEVLTSSDDVEAHASVLESISNSSIKSFTKSNVPAGTYYFAVACVDRNGNRSAFTLSSFEVKDTTPPAKVTGVQALPRELNIEVRWTANTEIDIKDYSLERSDNGTSGWAEIYRGSVNSYLDSVAANATKYYRVRAYDRSNNAGAYSDVVSAKALGISDLDGTAPGQVVGLTEINKGIELSSNTDTDNLWIEFSWTAVTGANRYYVYLDGKYFNQTTATSFRANGLYAKGSYSVQVSAVSKLNMEGTKSTTLSINTPSQHTVTVNPPAPIQVKQYFRGMVVDWNASGSTHIDCYELQYAANSSGTRPGTTDAEWTALAKPDGTTYVHGRLDYNLYYYYRLRTVDTYGVKSVWVYFSNDGMQPLKSGNDDLYFNSIYGDHMVINAVKAINLDTDAVLARHIKAKEINGDHIAGKAITTTHLDIVAGGGNFVRNSAFGMLDLDGNRGINWSMDTATIVDRETDPKIPTVDHALQMVHATSKTTTVTQVLDIPEDITIVTLSLWISTTNVIDGGSEKLFIAELYDSVTGRIGDPILVAGNTGWQFHKQIINLPASRNSIGLRLKLNSTTGTIRATCIKVEEGDVNTSWIPHSDEVYGAQGNVQINSSGIRITNGSLLIETNFGDNDSRVTMDASGIRAGGPSVYAEMTNAGFYAIGTAFTLKSHAADNTGFIFDSTSLRSFNSGKQTLTISNDGKLTITDGLFSMKSSDSQTTGVEIDSAGIRINKDGDLKFEASSSGSVSITDTFTIKSSGLDNRGFELNNQYIKAFSGTGAMTFKVDANDGSVSMGSALNISSVGFNADGTPKNAGARIVLRTGQWTDGNNAARPGGIYGYSNGSTNDYDETYMAYRLLENGEAYFNGSIHIYSTSTTNQVSIGPSGITGNGFKLLDGASGGLEVTNAKITQGNIEMGLGGMTVFGAAGIKITKEDKTTELVKIDHTGVSLKGEASLKIVGTGTITFGDSNTTAITSTGITCASLTSGTLFIQEGKAQIVVGTEANPDVLINKDGITINSGMLNVKDAEGDFLIEGGVVQAKAITVGTAGSNILKNGRSDFGIESWTCDSNVAQSTDYSATGTYSFRVNVSSAVQAMSQNFSVSGTKYISSAKLRVISGTVTVEIKSGSTVLATASFNPDASKWQTFKKRFDAGSGQHSIVIKSVGGGALFYVTDIMVSEGDAIGGYTAHPSEVKATNVSISNGTIKINTGSDKSVVIDETGIYKGTQFSLTTTGLSMNFANQAININDTDGIKVTSGSNYTQINSAGITSVGMFSLSGSSGKVIIDPTKVEVNDGGSNYAKLTTSGLEVLGEGFLNIKSSSDTNAARLEMKTNYIKLFKAGKATASVEIGNTSDPDVGYGILVRDGAFKIESNTDNAAVQLLPTEISVTHKKAGATRQSKLDADGLAFFENGKRQDYLKYTYVPKEPVVANTETSYTGFTRPPKVMVIPAEIQVFNYNEAYRNSNQFYRCRADNVQVNKFTPVVEYYIDSAVRTSFTYTSGTAPSYGMPHNGTWVARTNEPASKAGVLVSWSADGSHYLDSADHVEFWVYYSVNGSTWTEIGHQYRTGGWQSTDAGSMWFWSPQLSTRQQIYLKVVADVNDGVSTNQNSCTVSGCEYLAEITITPTNPPKVWFLAVEDNEQIVSE